MSSSNEAFGWDVVVVRPSTSYVGGQRGARTIEPLFWYSSHRTRAEADAVAHLETLRFFSINPPFLEVPEPIADFGLDFESFFREIEACVDELSPFGPLDVPIHQDELEQSTLFTPTSDAHDVIANQSLTFDQKVAMVTVNDIPPLYAIPPLTPITFQDWRLFQGESVTLSAAALIERFDLRCFEVIRTSEN